MQPRNPFQGQAPSNMQFPTDAYIRGVTNAANIQAEAQARMGQQLGEGIQKAAGAYKQYSDAKFDYSATQSMLKSPTFQKLLGLDEDSAGEFSKALATTQGEGGYSAANKQFSQLIDPLMRYAEMGRRYSQEQGLIGARADAANQQAAFETFLRLKATPSATPAAAPMATPAAPAVSTKNPIQPVKKKPLPWETHPLNVNDMGFGE